MKPFIKNPEEFQNIVIKKDKQFVLDIKFGGEPEPLAIWKFEDNEIIPDEAERFVYIIVIMLAFHILIIFWSTTIVASMPPAYIFVGSASCHFRLQK